MFWQVNYLDARFILLNINYYYPHPLLTNTNYDIFLHLFYYIRQDSLLSKISSIKLQTKELVKYTHTLFNKCLTNSCHIKQLPPTYNVAPLPDASNPTRWNQNGVLCIRPVTSSIATSNYIVVASDMIVVVSK